MDLQNCRHQPGEYGTGGHLHNRQLDRTVTHRIAVDKHHMKGKTKAADECQEISEINGQISFQGKERQPDYCNTGRRYIIFPDGFTFVKNQCRNGTMITYSVVINAFLLAVVNFSP